MTVMSGLADDRLRKILPKHALVVFRNQCPFRFIALVEEREAEGKAEIVDVVRYPAECVNPPANMTSTAWLEAGMPGAKCK